MYGGGSVLTLVRDSSGLRVEGLGCGARFGASQLETGRQVVGRAERHGGVGGVELEGSGVSRCMPSEQRGIDKLESDEKLIRFLPCRLGYGSDRSCGGAGGVGVN